MRAIVGKIYNFINPGPRFERIWKIAHIDFKKRYYDSYFGLVWALVNPLFRISVYYFVFTIFFPRNIENYALYLFCGLLTWMFFKECTNKCMNTLQQKSYLIDSLQFNKVDLFSSSISTLLGYLFNLSAYVSIALILGIQFNWRILLMLVLVGNIFFLSMSIGMILSTIKVYFKDISYFWDLLTLLGFWTSPILFRGEAILEKVPILMYLNPVGGIIMNSRSMLLYSDSPILWYWMTYDILFTIILFFLGKYIFKKYSHRALEYM